LRASRFYRGRPRRSDGLEDLLWLDPEGAPNDHDGWHKHGVPLFQMLRRTWPSDVRRDAGADAPPRDARTAPLVVNGSRAEREFALGGTGAGLAWELVWDSAWERQDVEAARGPFGPGEGAVLGPLSMRLLLSV